MKHGFCPVGDIFNGRYKILSPIGQGPHGTVYKAADEETGGIITLKIFRSEMSARESQVALFCQNARIWSRLMHANAARVLDFGRSKAGNLYVATEFLEGKTLREAIDRDGPMPLSRAVNIARQVADCLHHAHANGLVHGSLKPNNILILGAANETPKILDFGLAGFSESFECPPDLESVLYISSEQALGRIPDARSDLYSLGVILYEMLCGFPPFRASTPASVVLKHMHERAPGLEPTVAPPALRDLLSSLLEKDRSKRPASAARVAEEMAKILGRPTLWPSLAPATGADPFLLTQPPPARNSQPTSPVPTTPRAASAVDHEMPTLKVPNIGQDKKSLTASDHEPSSHQAIGPQESTLVPGPSRPPVSQPLRRQRRSLYALLALLVAASGAGIGVALASLITSTQSFAPTTQQDIVSSSPLAIAPYPDQGTKPKPPAPKEATLAFETAPPGAKVFVNDTLVGTTPLKITIRESDETFVLRFVLDGFEEQSITLDPRKVVASGFQGERLVLKRLSDKSESADRQPKRKPRVTKKPPSADIKPTLHWE